MNVVLISTERMKTSKFTIANLRATCENAVFFSNVELLDIRASIISSPDAPHLYIK